jgi:UDP-N-acetylmuramoylalanine--D-glutamate ligase
MEENLYRGKKITIMGLGLFGGGGDACRFFVARGADVTVTDLREEAELKDALAGLKGLPLRAHLGGHVKDDFTDADMVIANPAVPEDSEFLALARKAGVAVDYAMNVFFRRCSAPIVGVTGSNGKSTTTALVGELLKKVNENVWVSGNIGSTPLLENLENIKPDHIVVLELSSFQLEDLGEIGKSPHVAVVTNISPNHLDRHKTFANYIRAKKNIIAFQTETDACFLNRDDKVLRSWEKDAAGRAYFFSSGEELSEGTFLKKGVIVSRVAGREIVLDCLDRIQLLGMHNVENILAAVGAANLFSIAEGGAASALEDFKGLEHRLELAGELDGIRYYNDSIATTPESAIAALRSFTAPIVVIAGGYDKKVSLDAFADEIVERAKAAVLIGKTADTIAERIDAHPAGRKPPYYTMGDFGKAVERARELAAPGDVVLLAPACASYDMFKNFVERGRAFKTLVQKLKRQDSR